ncbi:MAG: nuclear transport factor 2 family protein [Chloroflexota bacterium]
MDESSARAAIERYWQAANTQDFDAVRDLFTDDVLVEWPQSGERVRGKEACINVFSSYPGGSPKLLGVRRVMGRDNMWVAEAELEYPGPQIYITVSVFEFTDGKISHEIDWFAEPFPAPEWRMQWVDQG